MNNFIFLQNNFAFFVFKSLREISDYQFLAKIRKRENAKNAKKICKLFFVVYERCLI